MKSRRIPSPARSQPATTPRRLRDRGSCSLNSPARSKPARLSTLVQQFQDDHAESFALSPVNRKSVLTDNTAIEERRRQSWWKKLDDNSIDVMEVLPSKKPSDNVNDVEDLFEELSQSQNKNESSLPDSSNSESIGSIILPQRKLFTEKENKPRKTIANVIGPRDTLAKLQKSKVESQDKTVVASQKKLFGQGPSQRPKPLFAQGMLDISANTTVPNEEPINAIPKKLFGQNEFLKPKQKFAAAISSASNKVSDGEPKSADDSEPKSAGVKNLLAQNQPRTKPVFPSALLDISQKSTGPNKTTAIATLEVKSQVRSLFGNRPGAKRKNMFVDLLYSESEDEILEIQPRVFGFPNRRGSSASRGVRDGSPTSSVTTDMELDDWKMLPSSTMMVDNLEEIPGNTPMKRPKLSKTDEQKKPEASSNSTADKTKQLEKSVSFKNKSKSSHNTSKTKKPEPDQVSEQLNSTSLSKNESNVKNVTQLSGEVNTNKEMATQQTITNKNARKSMKESIDNDGNIALEYDDDDYVEVQIVNQVDEHENIKINGTTIQEVTEVGIKKITLANDDHVNLPDQPVNSDEQNSISKKDSSQSAAKIQVTEKSQKVVEESTEKVQQNSEVEKSMEVLEHNDVEPEQIQNKAEKSVLQDDEEMVQSVLHDEEDDEIEDDNAQGDGQESTNEEVEEDKAEEENEPSVLQDEEGEEIDELEPTEEQEVESEEDEAANHEDEEIEDDEHEPTTEQENYVSVDQDVAEHSVEQDQGDDDDDGQESTNEEVEEDKAEEENEPSVLQDEEGEEIDELELTEVQDVESEEDEAANYEDEEIEDDEHEPTTEQENYVSVDQDVAEHSVEQDQGDIDENVDEEADHPNDANNDVEEDEGEEMALTYEEEEDNNESVEASDKHDDQEQEVEQGNEGIEIEEVDNEEEENDNQEADASQEEIAQPEDADSSQEEIAQPEDADASQEDKAQPEETDQILETPNATMDTTGRNRKKKANETNVRSLEAILHHKSNLDDTFEAQGRNTSVRKTKSMISPDIRPSIAPIRASVGSNTDSSAQGSGWDSHRVTRKTMRQTFGKDFTPRKSLRAMVMEKSAKRQTYANEVHAGSMKVPQANSTEIGNEISMPNMQYEDAAESDATDRDDTNDRDAPSDLDTSGETGNNILEVMQKLKLDAIERNKKIAEKVRQSIREPSKALLIQYTYIPSCLSMPQASRKITKPPKPRKRSGVPLGEVPTELLEDMKYKPPKRFRPSNASWATKRLYKFLELKLEPKYDYKARVRAEKLVEHIYRFSQDIRRLPVAPREAINELKQEMARLSIVKTHFEFYQFFHDYMPREIRVKVNPDIVNKLPLPKKGVFSDILQEIFDRG